MTGHGLQPSELAPNLWVGADVRLGEVSIGINVIIYDGTVVEDGVTLQDGVIVGKPPKLAPHSSAQRKSTDGLVLERGATVCSGATVFVGARIGPEAIVGDQAHVRERAVVGERTVIGRGSAIGVETTVGARVRVQTNCWLTSWSEVEDDVFVGPGVTTMNDDSMGRRNAGAQLRGPILRRACRVGGGVLLTPGVEVGEEAFVGAGAVVTRDVAPRTRVMGVPARAFGEVADDELVERWR